VFSADRTQNVIVRLRHNVIRTGLRRINLAYSRIGLADVAAKLGLPDAGDVECIVAKAIKCAAHSATSDLGGLSHLPASSQGVALHEVVQMICV